MYIYIYFFYWVSHVGLMEYPVAICSVLIYLVVVQH